MALPPGQLSGEYWNPLVDEGVAFFRDLVDWLEAEVFASGYPPFSEPITDEEELYIRLFALKAVGAPAFWQDPQAAAELDRLAAKFGRPPEATSTPPPLPGRLPLVGGVA